jgi:hypothetical protein
MTEPHHHDQVRRRVLIAAGVLVAVVVAAWLVERGVDGSGQAPAGSPKSSAYAVNVERGGKVLRRFTVTDLHRLAQTQIVSDGKPQNGPSLPVVLAAAGVHSGYSAVEVRGMGIRDKGRLMLTAAKVNGKVVLDFNDRGTVKIVSPSMDVGQRVRDVTAIVVR